MAVAALAAAAMAVPPTAIANTTDATFDGGSLTGLEVNAAFSQASVQNLLYRYEDCGTQRAEKTCTWELRASLSSDPAHRCVPSTPESQLLWDSGEESGNGLIESGPFSFALEGCSGQVLNLYYEEHKTFNPEEEEGPWKTLSTGSSAPLLSIRIGADSEEGERRIPTANPPANPVPSMGPPTLAVSANCRSLKIRNADYVFVFRRMGCHKATSLATEQLSQRTPSGYRCVKKSSGGIRCSRVGDAKKYVEWHIPSRTVRR